MIEKALYAAWAASWAAYVDAEGFREDLGETVEQAQSRAKAAMDAAEKAISAALADITIVSKNVEGRSMTAKEAWEELIAKFPWAAEEGSEPIYFWEPGPDTPVAPNHAPSNHEAGWRWTVFAEDIPLAYLVVRRPDAIGQIVVYAKWPRQGWDANPQTRHLINHLVGRVNEVKQ